MCCMVTWTQQQLLLVAVLEIVQSEKLKILTPWVFRVTVFQVSS